MQILCYLAALDGLHRKYNELNAISYSQHEYHNLSQLQSVYNYHCLNVPDQQSSNQPQSSNHVTVWNNHEIPQVRVCPYILIAIQMLIINSLESNQSDIATAFQNKDTNIRPLR